MKKNVKTFLKSPWTKLISILGAFSTIFGMGYVAADYKTQIECNFEKIKLQQEYNEKIQTTIDNCRELKIQEYQESVKELKTIIKDLSKRGHGK